MLFLGIFLKESEKKNETKFKNVTALLENQTKLL